MKNLRYEFLDPFMEKEFVKEGITKAQVLSDFEKINWHKLVKDSYSGNKNGNTDKKELAPQNDFWYFNSSYLDSQDQKLQLLIVPNFAIDDSFLGKRLAILASIYAAENDKSTHMEKTVRRCR
ncbi:hypothetical protein [Zobellia uliginosa]|uniref:hypothetical protein n=1 Tax=Zobellia uliginosa TaxID=143224 RepID=UPI0026E1BBA0|nr:hypothetical protein [Zobellia uliginosa]MDO6519034.1 hypothetical protein [Zobellia uliginosa]